MFFWLAAIVALAGWTGLTVWGADEALWMRLVRPLTAVLAMGSAFVGTILPLFGFQMEVTGGRHQDADWRRALLKERTEARVGGYEPRRYPEAISSGRGLEAVLEPKGEPLSAIERVPVG